MQHLQEERMNQKKQFKLVLCSLVSLALPLVMSALGCASTKDQESQHKPASPALAAAPSPETQLKRHIDDMALTRVDPKTGSSFALGTGWAIAADDDLKSYLISRPYVSVSQNNKTLCHLSTGLLYSLEQNPKNTVGAIDLSLKDSLACSSAAMSSDGSLAVIGAPEKNSGGGGVFLFARGEGGWVASDKGIIISVFGLDGKNKGDGIGSSVALSGNGTTFLWGAPGEQGHGKAHYLLKPSAGWTTVRNDVALRGGELGLGLDKALAGAQFGKSVAISRDDTSILIGAPGADKGRGGAYLFRKPADGWIRTKGLTALPLPEGLAAGSRFGDKVCLSADGGVMAVSAPRADDGTGAVYVFLGTNLDADTKTIRVVKIPLVNHELGAGLSLAISADGRTLVFGCLGRDNRGFVSVYGSSSGDWQDAKSLTTWRSNDPKPDDFFGYSLALSADGTKVLVGSPGSKEGDGTWMLLDARAAD
jgi:hypothetical protein